MTSRDATRDERKLRAAAYEKAASLIGDAVRNDIGYFHPCACCEAISMATTGWLEGADLESPFKALFKPETDDAYWWGDCMCSMPETQVERALALSFMAAMVEAGDA